MTPRDFDTIASLHIDGIHHGILPLFGHPFLSALYREMAAVPRTSVHVERDGDEVIGFVAGCERLSEMYRRVLVRRGPKLALIAGRALLSPSVLRKMPSLLTYLNGAPSDEPELLAIAVSGRARSKGVGRKLVAALENDLRSWGARRYRVSTNIEEIDSNAFYRRLGFQPAGTVKHHALTLQVYEKELT